MQIYLKANVYTMSVRNDMSLVQIELIFVYIKLLLLLLLLLLCVYSTLHQKYVTKYFFFNVLTCCTQRVI